MFVLTRLMAKYTAKKLKSIFCLGRPEEGIRLGAKENKLLHIEKNWKQAEEKKGLLLFGLILARFMEKE